MTYEEATSLSRGEFIYLPGDMTSTGTTQKWRVNGAYKTWKTKPGVFMLPIKHGLRNFGHLTNENYQNFQLKETL